MSEDSTLRDAPTFAERPGRPRRPSTSSELERGTMIGRYVIIDQLGAGGMGVVYAAYDPDLNRRVALKLVQAGEGGSGGAPPRVLREAQALARLNHPNVVSIYDVGTIGQRVFLAMELVEGDTVKQWLEATKRTWREVVDVFAAAGRGLAAAHAGGVIHRDFKPGNVIVGKDGRVRVLDFGLARAARESSPSLPPPVPSRSSTDALNTDITQAGSVLGTPVYMPPEAYRAEVVSEPGDQFSFCVALYEALYGERPFDHAFADELPPVAAPPTDTKVPVWVRKIVLRGLSARIADRFSSMNALLGALADDPAIRRRKWLAALSATALVGAIVFVAVRVQGKRPQLDDPCAVAAPLAGTWDDSARSRVHAAFTASHVPEAEADFARAASAIDETSKTWLSARANACAETREQHREPEAVLLLRLACLDRQKEDLAALVELFARADAQLVGDAAQAVGQLGGAALCANARSLAYVEPPPDDKRERATELRLRLSQGRALLLAGRDREAGDLLRSLVEDARTLGYGPLLAEALYLLGRHDLDDFANAIRHLDEAESVALANHVDAIAARAAAARLTEGSVAGREDAVLDDWSERARAWVRRDGDLEAEFDVEQSLGILAEHKGDHSAAEAHLRRSIEVGTRAYGGANTRVFGAESTLAFTLIQLGRYDDAVAMLGPAIDRFERANGSGSVRLRDALDNYGLALATIGRFKDARAALERALSFGDDADIARGALLCDLARVALAEGDTAQAIQLGERGVKQIKDLRVEKINLAINEDPLAAAYVAARRYDDGLAVSRECIAEFVKAGNDGIDTVPCLAIEGEALLELDRAKEALDVLDRARRLQIGHPAAPGMLANLEFQLARALVASGGDHERAADLVNDARAELQKYPFLAPLMDRVDAWRGRSGLR
jgi:tetratricopeptide (TPR) repeat protein